MESSQSHPKKGLPCPKCGNRLRVRPDQLGEQVSCPKCGASFTIGRPGPPPPPPPRSPDDPYEPEVPLVRSSIVPDEPEPARRDFVAVGHVEPPAGPVPIIHEAQPQMVDPDAAAEEMIDLDDPATRELAYDAPSVETAQPLVADRSRVPPPSLEPDYLKLAKAKGLLRHAKKPYQPRWTFFSDVFEFPWRGPNLWRYGVMVLGFVFVGAVFVPIIELMRRPPDLLMPILAMVAAVMLLLALAASSAFFMAAVEDTADGFKRVQDSLPDVADWFFSFFRLVLIALASGAIGYPLALIEEIGPVAIPISGLILFPVLALSAMECESFVLPYSPAVLRTLWRYASGWFMFYLLTIPLVVGWFVATAVAFPYNPFVVVVFSALVLPAVVLIYARLLGRVAWKASLQAPPERRAEPGESKRSKKRKRNVFPEDLTKATQMLADRSQGPPGLGP